LKLAEKGDLSKIDLLMKEFYPKGLGLYNSKGSIAHFGKIKNPSKSDLALGIVNMVGQVIGTVAALAAKTNNHRYIILTGKLPQSKLVRDLIKKRILKFHKAKIIVSKNTGVATAIGTNLNT
jgi:pantothenate kinase